VVSAMFQNEAEENEDWYLWLMTHSTTLRASVLAFVGIALVGCKESAPKDAKGPDKARTTKLAATIAVKSPFADPLTGLGSVDAADRVEVKVEIAGRVKEIRFREGRPVRRGDVLVVLEDADWRAQRERAAARARLASATLGRVREQLRVEAASAQQVEAAAADSAVARAELALADVALDRTQVRAPFDGVAGLCDLSIGQWLQAGQFLTAVVSRKAVQIDWSLPERLATSVGQGQAISWKDPGSGRSGQAVVAALDASLDEATRTRRLKAVCRSSCEALLPGSSVELQLPSDSAPVLSVPSQVLSGNAAGLALYVYHGGKAALVPVVAGRRSTDRLEILSGLAAGDTVLFPGASPPKPGTDVEIARFMGADGSPGKEKSGKDGAKAAGRKSP